MEDLGGGLGAFSQYNKFDAIREFKDIEYIITNELRAFMAMASSTLASLKDENNAYFFFKDRIDEIAKNYEKYLKRIDLSLGGNSGDGYKAIQLISTILETLAPIFHQAPLSLLETLFTTESIKGMKKMTSDSFLKYNVNRTISIMESAAIYGFSENYEGIKARNITIKNIMNFLVIVLNAIYDILYVASVKGVAYIAMYVELLFALIFVAQVMVGNVLYNWFNAVSAEPSKKFIDTEIIVAFISVGSILNYIVISCINENRFSTLEEIVDKVFVNNLGQLLIVLDNIHEKCNDSECYSSELAESYSDYRKSAYFEMSMSLYQN